MRRTDHFVVHHSNDQAFVRISRGPRDGGRCLHLGRRCREPLRVGAAGEVGPDLEQCFDVIGCGIANVYGVAGQGTAFQAIRGSPFMAAQGETDGAPRVLLLRHRAPWPGEVCEVKDYA